MLMELLVNSSLCEHVVLKPFRKSGCGAHCSSLLFREISYLMYCELEGIIPCQS